MCILRYLPRNDPSASITAHVLWYRPGARRSNREATIAILFSRASLGGFAYFLDRAGEILRRVLGRAHLY
jgi:hypothetical protein